VPQPNESEKPRKTKPNWVDIATLCVLSATLIGVFIYAREAHKQNVLIAQSVEQEVLNNRPVVYENGVAPSERTQDSIPSKVKIRFKNLGKSLALTVVSVGHILVRSAGEPTPVDLDCNENGALPKVTKMESAIAPSESSEPEWSPAQNEDLSEVYRSGKVLYVVGCVYYFGLDRQKRYFSDLCVTWAPNAPQDFQSCDDPNRNYAH